MTLPALLLAGLLVGGGPIGVPGHTVGPPDPSPPLVWGADGHRLVCEVASHFLSSEARTLVEALRAEQAGSFSDSCLWADEVRPSRPETAALHYVNIPQGTPGVDLDRDCGEPELRCAPRAIVQYAAILADGAAPPADRLEALLFVSHFVGDLHQPLHAGRPGDRGGNEVRVTFFGTGSVPGSRMDLHRIWDRELLLRAGLRHPDAVGFLLEGIGSEELTAWGNDDVIGWTNESYQLNESFVYVPVGTALADGYFGPAVQIVVQRLRQAGVRLAFVLNQAARGIPIRPLG
jgi:hypothetical protein